MVNNKIKEINKDDLIDYSLNEINSIQFFQFPKWLLKMNIKNDSKLLYMLLRDRYSLSIANEWIDEDNKPYIIYTRKQVQTDLGIANDKCISLFKELKENGLIYEKVQGLRRPNLIFLKTPNIKKIFSDIGKNDLKTSEKPTSRNLKKRSQDIGKTDTNNTDLSKTVCNNINNNNIDETYKYSEEVKETVVVDVIENDSDKHSIKSRSKKEVIKEVDKHIVSSLLDDMYFLRVMEAQGIEQCAKDVTGFLEVINKQKIHKLEQCLKLNQYQISQMYKEAKKGIDNDGNTFNNIGGWIISCLNDAINNPIQINENEIVPEEEIDEYRKWLAASFQCKLDDYLIFESKFKEGFNQVDS